MEKSINYYKEQFKTLIEEMCKEMQVSKAKVYVGCQQDSQYEDSFETSCDIDFDD